MEHIKHNSWMWRAANCNSGSFYGLWWGWENSLKALKFFHLLHSTKAARAFYCCICTSTAMLFGTSPKTAFNKYSKIYTIKWATEEKYDFELKRKKKRQEERPSLRILSEYPVIYCQTKTNFYGATGLLK